MKTEDSSPGNPRKPGRPKCTAPGMERMRDATPEGKCPYCLDDIPPKKVGAKAWTYCGDPICLTAKHRTRKRDIRRGDRLAGESFQ